MTRVLIVSRDDETGINLRKNLSPYGLTCSLTSDANGVRDSITSHKPDILLFEMHDSPAASKTWQLARKISNDSKIPVIALIPGEVPEAVDSLRDVDDFITRPYDARELMLRINRLAFRPGDTENKEQIKHNDLTIDLVTCEVTVAGEIIELTFKEYELLKLLASNPGRVYTRENLLDKIWGYDYFGGDRTVDVHVRRLRSKIEDANHTFIETVRNIGYRFIKNS
jgi:two-component system alkaline phosphatase synthesis response regulator PhoP